MNYNNTFNKIFNEKNALKAFTRNVLHKQTVVDLNDKFCLGLSLPKSRTFPKVRLKNQVASSIHSPLSLSWNLVSHSVSKQNVSSFFETPLTKYEPSNGFIYRRSYFRRKRSALTFRNNIKSNLVLYHARTRFAKFRDLYIKKSSLASKAFFLRFHKRRRYIFIRPKFSALNCGIYTSYDRKKRRIRIKYVSKSGVLSKRQVFYSLFNKYYAKKRIAFLQRTNKVFNGLSKKRNLNEKLTSVYMKLRGFKKLRTSKILEKLKAFCIKKQLLSTVPESQKLSSKKIKSFKSKELVKTYKKLNENSKELIKQTIKGANLELLKSALLKKKSKFTSKRSFKYKAKKSKSSGVLEHNKGKFKVCDPRKSILVTKFNFGFERQNKKLSKKKSTKSKFDKKGTSKFKSKVSTKTSSSKE